MTRRFAVLSFFLGMFVQSFAFVNDSSIHLHYSWVCDKQEKECFLDIDERLLEYYRNDRTHLFFRYQTAFENESEEPVNYFMFMCSEYDRNVVRALASQLVDPSMSDFEKTQSALCFVQSLEYALDTVSMGVGEYVRYPVETLVDRKGDCEDKAMLLGALLFELDIDFVLLVLPDHMALGVHFEHDIQGDCVVFQGKPYYFMETTGKNWKIGEIPIAFRDLPVEAFMPSATPVLVFRGFNLHSERRSSNVKDPYTLQFELLNAGPNRITGLRLRLQLVEDDLKGDAVLDQTFPLEDLLEEEQRSQTIEFKCKVKKNSVLKATFSGDRIPDRELEILIKYGSSGG